MKKRLASLSIPLFLLTAAAAAAAPPVSHAGQAALTNASLNGEYFVRQIQFTTNASNVVTDARSMFGSIDFDGAGNYSVFAEELINSGQPEAGFIVSGTYTVSAAGMVTMVNPLNNTMTINARFGTEAVIGSSTDATGSVFEMFVAIPEPPGGGSDASLGVNFHMADFELTNASTAQIRVSGMSAQFDGAGNIQRFQPLGHVASFESGATQESEQFTGTYSVGSTGSGTVTFTPVAGTTTASSLLLSGAARDLYVSATGNVFLAATPGAHDILIGIRNGAADTIGFSGRNWLDRIRVDAGAGTSLDYVGAGTIVTSGSTAIVSARYHEAPPPAGFSIVTNETFTLPYAKLTAGFGSGCQCGIGSYGNVVTSAGNFIMSGNNGTLLTVSPGVNGSNSPNDPGGFEIIFGVQIPTLAGTGVWVNPQGVVSSATYAPVGDYIAPGEFISIYGSGLAGEIATASSLPFQPTLGNVSVSINNHAAPMFYVSAGLIICIVPYEVTGNTATIVVTNNGTPSNSVTVGAAAAAPGVISANDFGFGDGAITHADNQSVNTANPADVGETVQMYVMGLGGLNTAVVDGNGFTGIDDAGATPPTVLVNDIPANVSYWGLTVDAGLYQINFTVPDGVSNGEQSVTVATPDAVTTTITIAVQVVEQAG